MLRIVAWLGFISLAGVSVWLDNTLLRGLCAPALLLALAAGIPVLRPALLGLCGVAIIPVVLGYGESALALMPALIAALIGWIFARTLRSGRRPLIARMIAAMDGEEMLRDEGIARYARRLTGLWAGWQGALALLGLLLAIVATCCAADWRWLPGARLFGAVLLPAAVVALLLGEFLLRPHLLPQAPRRSLPQFLHGLLRAWPAALND
ncbi:MAG TPA: hypothetical protein VGH81_03460 [Rudaea sp.]